MYENRFYRNYNVTGTVPFQVTVRESDLFIRADYDLSKKAKTVLLKVRSQLERYIQGNPIFERSMVPLMPDPMAPKIVREMLAASAKAGIGPMSAVAGAVAQAVGTTLLEDSEQVMVENGGDIFLALKEDLPIGIYAGKSVLSGRVGLRLKAADSPCGLCTSSGTVGHSHSEGKADSVTILSSDTALADSVATAAGNLVKGAGDITKALDYAMSVSGVLGACIIYKDKLGAQGGLELVDFQ